MASRTSLTHSQTDNCKISIITDVIGTVSSIACTYIIQCHACVGSITNIWHGVVICACILRNYKLKNRHLGEAYIFFNCGIVEMRAKK